MNHAITIDQRLGLSRYRFNHSLADLCHQHDLSWNKGGSPLEKTAFYQRGVVRLSIARAHADRIRDRVAVERTMASELAEELSRRGLRATRQRIAVLDLLLSSGRHLPALEIFTVIRRTHPRVSKKTIYEVLDSMCRADLARCITEGGKQHRYEEAKAPHYHARCRISRASSTTSSQR